MTYTIFIETMFLNETKEAAMTILDISMLTGFFLLLLFFFQLMGKDKYVHRFELSDRGSVIIYLKKVSNKFKERIAFRVHMMLNVGVPQPAAATVYEYYSKENQCVKFYDPHMEQSSGSIRILCPKEVCSCAEVYKATLELVTRSGSTDIYTFTIIRVIKEGTDKNVLDHVREFYAHIACRNKFGLEEGKNYLIMGPEPKLIKEEYLYMLGTSTWLEYWPTQQESQENKDNNKERHIGLSGVANLLEEYGCTT
ncbi:hypothetical protein PDJAM_G00162280 [Pangasius djambal]|uniref:Uncharacterized protein n=1 Tax=Pangasius djambal TaxID=1691987 RepID=A0ACC5ZJJ7_9TELE|nr:hypothetical protein [Pangasius djambal]